MYEHNATKQELCSDWLQNFCTLYADTSPIQEGVFFLPMRILKTDIYAEMKLDFFKKGITGEELPSEYTFLYVWRTKFQNLSFSRPTNSGDAQFAPN